MCGKLTLTMCIMYLLKIHRLHHRPTLSPIPYLAVLALDAPNDSKQLTVK